MNINCQKAVTPPVELESPSGFECKTAGLVIQDLTVYFSGIERHYSWSLSEKSLESVVLVCLEMHFPAWSKVFLQTLFKKKLPQDLGAHTNTSVQKYF